MQPFVISIKGLKPGKTHYEWQIGGEFFKTFENSEVLDADLKVVAHLAYTEESAELECSIEGSVVVVCDRCLEELTLTVDTDFVLEEEDLDLSRGEIDFRQDVYDYVCISLPMQRVHADGECNGETVKFLSR